MPWIPVEGLGVQAARQTGDRKETRTKKVQGEPIWSQGSGVEETKRSNRSLSLGPAICFLELAAGLVGYLLAQGLGEAKRG